MVLGTKEQIMVETRFGTSSVPTCEDKFKVRELPCLPEVIPSPGTAQIHLCGVEDVGW